MNSQEICFEVSACSGKPQRIVIASTTEGNELHRGSLNTNSEASRKTFLKGLGTKLDVPVAELIKACDNRLVQAADEADVRVDAEADKVADMEPPGRPSQATQLTYLAEHLDLWHTPDDDAFTTLSIDGHQETWPIRSKSFKRWLARRFYLATESAPNSQAMQDALGVVEGKAVFEGPQHTVHTRIAEHEGIIYLDLVDQQWRVVEITTDGWQVLDRSPVRFRRAKAMLPLPIPERGGSVAQLRAFVNCSDENWVLVLAWLVAAFRPSGPYPVLCLLGEQGSAKSTTARVLRSLVDPNSAPLRSEPRETRDLMIAANNGWVLTYDNLSKIPSWLSDSLCRLSTGGGFSTRTLYENSEETIFDAQRPAILTSIEDVANRGDLLDRSLLVNLQSIPPGRRRPEREFWIDFEAVRPSILGAMLTAVSTAMKLLPSTKLDELPRMADFAMWVTAAEPALGLEDGDFLATYKGNEESANELVLESSPVANVLLEMISDTPCWEGTATELLAELDSKAGEKTLRLKSWPKTGQTLSGILKRLAPNFRAAGIDVTSGHTGRGKAKRRSITIRKTADSCVPSDPNVPNTEKQEARGDASTTTGDVGGTQQASVEDACSTASKPCGDAGDAKLRLQSDPGDESAWSPEEEAAYEEFMER